MKRKLSERAAWLKLAKIWDGAKPYSGSDCYHVLISTEPDFGLCTSVWELCQKEKGKDDGLLTAMDDRMKHNLPATGQAFWWPRDAEGAKARAAFCREMAKLCAKPKAKKKAKKP